MVKEGYYFGLPPLFLGVAACVFSWWIAGIILLLLAAFVFSFFRDPERAIPANPGAIVSPADGRIVVLKDEDYAGRPGKRISVFLAIWNVRAARDLAWDFADHLLSLTGIARNTASMVQDRLTGVVGRSLLTLHDA